MKAWLAVGRWLVTDDDKLLPEGLRRLLGPRITALVEAVLVGFAILLTAALFRLNVPLSPQ
jgi:hypothetical protein